MIIKAKFDYIAGGWPGGRYTGQKYVTFNVADDATFEYVKERAIEYGQHETAKEYCMSIGAVTVFNIILIC